MSKRILPPVKFAMLGAAGFVAPRHMEAIWENGDSLVAACDPYDGVGVLDRWFPDVRFFTEVERFDRHLEKLRRRGEGVDFVSVCSPNYLHGAHCRLAMRLGADVVCEKPLVLSPWNLDQLAQIEEETGCKVNTILQLRLHPEVRRLKAHLEADRRRVKVHLDYVTRRGPWYHQSWKGDAKRSGGVATNIGIHLFDLLLHLFGPLTGQGATVEESTASRLVGSMALEWADVTWKLSVDGADLPEGCTSHAWRALTMDGQAAIDFSAGFTGLHTKAYGQILAGDGFGLEDARPAVELAHLLSN
ncbi:MAG: Gfo/Idh/MocA family oxidoreductase [Actinomycetales bacterium]|nr:Gfo/Idh/MocA family oxidoreductase [Actinomycetales bacterium]